MSPAGSDPLLERAVTSRATTATTRSTTLLLRSRAPWGTLRASSTLRGRAGEAAALVRGDERRWRTFREGVSRVAVPADS